MSKVPLDWSEAVVDASEYNAKTPTTAEELLEEACACERWAAMLPHYHRQRAVFLQDAEYYLTLACEAERKPKWN